MIVKGYEQFFVSVAGIDGNLPATEVSDLVDERVRGAYEGQLSEDELYELTTCITLKVMGEA